MAISRRQFTAGAVALSAIGIGGNRVTVAQSPLTPPANLVSATPLEALDGEKIRAVVNGERIIIRLIGCDAPEPEVEDNTTECGFLTSRQALNDLVVGKTLLLETDQEDLDGKERLWRHVWLVNPDGTDGGLLNLQMLALGWCTTQEEEKNTKYGAEYAAAAKEAQTSKLGVLSTCSNFHQEINRRGGHDDPAVAGETISVKGVAMTLNSYYYAWSDSAGLAPTGGYKFLILNLTVLNQRESGKFDYSWESIAGKDLDTAADYDNPDTIYLSGGESSAELSPGEYAIVETAIEVQETATNVRVKYTIESDFALYWLTPA